MKKPNKNQKTYNNNYIILRKIKLIHKIKVL